MAIGPRLICRVPSRSQWLRWQHSPATDASPPWLATTLDRHNMQAAVWYGRSQQRGYGGIGV